MSERTAAISPQDLSPEGRALLADIMRRREVQIGQEIAKLEAERVAVLEWLAAHDSESGRDE
jgi:hypothetical protein